MTDAPLVSCIIIFLNGEPFLEAAIASIVAQTYARWELLLVDDGSSDGSSELARRYADQQPSMIRYLEHEGHQNRGMSASRNLGISQSRGQYIGFLDADDLWLPRKLEEQVALLQAHPEAGMVYGRTTIWHSWRGVDGAQLDHVYDLGVAPDTLVQPPALAIQLLQNKHQTPTTCNALMRRQVIEQVGSFEERFRAMYEDQAFFFKVELAFAVYVADARWALYRQHEQSASALSERIEDYYASRRPFLGWCQHYLNENGVRDARVWRALRRELWPCQHPQLHSLLAQGSRIIKHSRRAIVGAIKFSGRKVRWIAGR